jgi:PhoPQ-activated pathogenicity-related protein
MLALRSLLLAALAALFGGIWQIDGQPLGAAETTSGPLAEYVRQPDASYQWKKVGEGTVGSARYTELLLTSQKWRDILWKHQLFVIVPKHLDPKARHAVLMISGGQWTPKLEEPGPHAEPTGELDLLAVLASRLHEPVALLSQVPFQPLFNRSEDALIAYTFDKYLETGDSTWPLLLPMVKSAVRGMDAVQAFAKQESSLQIEKFTMAGISKRGWTTWLAGAVDRRVAGIVPIVIDVLNMKPHAQLEMESFGHFSEQVNDYTQYHLQERMNTPRGQALRQIVDPFSYLTSLTMPKLLMMGTNDPYWPLESANLYWHDLPGEKYLLYVPNEGHGLRGVTQLADLLAFEEHVAKGKALPKLEWQFAREAGTLHLSVKSDVRPQSLLAWTSKAKTRDFRGSTWNSQPISERDGTYKFDLAVPEQGFAALFAMVTFTNGILPYYLSTTVRIVGNAEKKR